MTNMKEKFDHILSTSSVRQMCINNNYYTAGDCRAYENMFNMFYGKNVTPKLLRKVAEDIRDHSVTEDSLADILYNLQRLVVVNIVFD